MKTRQPHQAGDGGANPTPTLQYIVDLFMDPDARQKIKERMISGRMSLADVLVGKALTGDSKALFAIAKAVTDSERRWDVWPDGLAALEIERHNADMHWGKDGKRRRIKVRSRARGARQRASG